MCPSGRCASNARGRGRAETTSAPLSRGSGQPSLACAPHKSLPATASPKTPDATHIRHSGIAPKAPRGTRRGCRRRARRTGTRRRSGTGRSARCPHPRSQTHPSRNRNSSGRNRSRSGYFAGRPCPTRDFKQDLSSRLKKDDNCKQRKTADNSMPNLVDAMPYLHSRPCKNKLELQEPLSLEP